jgi:NADPH-dependent ferric siderophore reductase
VGGARPTRGHARRDGSLGRLVAPAEADWYLFAGDEAAFPAIAAGLEALPARPWASPGWRRIRRRTPSPDGPGRDGDPLAVPPRPARRTTSLLADAVAAADWPAGRAEAFVHGERGAMKALRDVLFKQRGLERGQVSLSGYWAYGRAEDRFQAEKREPIGRILD